MTLVYLDANVLVPSFTRTLLIMSAPSSDFRVAWSLYAEAEAERHQPAGAVPISSLRQRFGWDALVPDGDVALSDTDIKDRPILSSASLAAAEFVVTENVKDFGSKDLHEFQMSAVHADLFLARRLTLETYRAILTRLAKARANEPKTADEIHRIETGACLPLLAARMAEAYPVTPEPASKGRPRLLFRGVRCVGCSNMLNDAIGRRCGLCSDCRSGS